jgi:hypothetical protein
MIHDEKTAAPDSSTPSTHVEPPKIYFTACGAACDIFWWARRNPPAAEQTPAAPPPTPEK